MKTTTSQTLDSKLQTTLTLLSNEYSNHVHNIQSSLYNDRTGRYQPYDDNETVFEELYNDSSVSVWKEIKSLIQQLPVDSKKKYINILLQSLSKSI